MTNKTSINHKFFGTLRVLLVFCALGMFFSLSALAQEEQQRILPKPQPVPVQPQPIDGNVPCPDPQTITLTAPPPSAANVDPSQLPASLVSPPNAEPNFGGTTPDKVFRHTFQFNLPQNKCCQCTNVTLTLKLKALQDALDPNHSAADASNDKWYIYKNGEICKSSSFPGYGWVYDKPTNQGTVITKTIRIPCECLAVHGNAGKLTFVIQDDTSVQSATLTGNGCCVRGMQDPR